MFAQANSEHCRHKIFNADWIVDGEKKDRVAVRDDPPHARGQPAGHGAGVRGQRGDPRRRRCAALLSGSRSSSTRRKSKLTHIVIKCETHNHPTAISPFPGAATGSGGEIRDEGATGRGAKPKAGLVGFSVSNLRIPGLAAALGGARLRASPARIASALEIMLDGPIGAASFNNEFGRPNLAGYFRTFEQSAARSAAITSRSCWPGGVGNAAARCSRRRRTLPAGSAADPARRPGHADRHGRRRRLLDGRRREHRGPRLRLGAARQRRDPAPRAGGDRPLLAAGRGATRSCRSTTSAPAACRTRCPSWCTAPAAARASTCAPCPPRTAACRRARSGATRRRSATCWRSRRTA